MRRNGGGCEKRLLITIYRVFFAKGRVRFCCVKLLRNDNLGGTMMKVFVSGCFDLMHSGHVFFFERAAAYGDLYVAIGSDKTIRELKKREPVCCEDERLYLVSSVRFVHRAFIGSGSGMLDFLPELDIVRPDVFVVNEDGATEEKRRLCEERNIRYVVLPREPKEKLPRRSTTDLRKLAETK